MQSTDESSLNNALRQSRKQLDGIDSQILGLLKRRSEIVTVITHIKKDNGMVAHQPERYKAMLERLQAEAARMDLDEQLVREVWDAIHAASLRQQKLIINPGK